MGEEDSGAAGESVYCGLQKPDRLWLRRVAAEVRGRLRRTVRDMLEVGRALVRARRRLGRDRWAPWLAGEAQLPRRSAYRLLSVARAFGSTDSPVLDRFTPTGLYALVEPGVPQSLREYALERAAAGEEVTAAVVREWLAAYRENPEASVKLASKDVPTPADIDPGEVHAAENWLLFCGLLVGGASVHLSQLVDAENGEAVVSATVLGESGRRSATGVTLEQVLLTLCQVNRSKTCPRCPAGTPSKPLELFSRRKDRPDGRNRYCLACERARVAAHARRKAETRKAG